MHETIQKMAQAFEKQREKRRRACAAFTALAILVSISTTYLLVQPANTMAVDYVCGMEEHTHSEECYRLICGYDDESDIGGGAAVLPGENEATETEDPVIENTDEVIDNEGTIDEGLVTEGETLNEEASSGETQEPDGPVAEEPVTDESVQKSATDEQEPVVEETTQSPVSEEPAVSEPAQETPEAAAPAVPEPEASGTPTEKIPSVPEAVEPTVTEPVVESEVTRPEAPAQQDVPAVVSEPVAEPAASEVGEASVSGTLVQTMVHYDNVTDAEPSESVSTPVAPGEPAAKPTTPSESVVVLSEPAEEPSELEPAGEPTEEVKTEEEPSNEGPATEDPVEEEIPAEDENRDETTPDAATAVEDEASVEEEVADAETSADQETTSGGNEVGHVHTAECYELICDLPEHEHSEDCMSLMNLLEDLGELPEGYTNEYGVLGDGYTVAVFAPNGALPEGAELMATLLEEGDKAHATAEQTLEAMVAQELAINVAGVMSETALEEAAANSTSEETESEEIAEPVEEAVAEETEGAAASEPAALAEELAVEEPASETEQQPEEAEKFVDVVPVVGEETLTATLVHNDNAPADAPPAEEPAQETQDEGISETAEAIEKSAESEKVAVEEENKAELSAEIAEEPISYEEEFKYDGFAALDIHFELDGEEIEPEKPVFVYIDIKGLLPEEADPESVAIQHHVEAKAEEEDELTLLEKLIPALAPAPVIESVDVVADSNENTGMVETSGEDVTTIFAVESFSTFTVTWTNTDAKLKIHYVDDQGNALDATLVTKPDKLKYGAGKTALMDDYAKNFIGEGYYYLGTYTKDDGGKRISSVKYTEDGGFQYSDTAGNWHEFSKLTANVYLRYKYMIDDTETPREVAVKYTDLGGESGQVVESGGTNTSKESDQVSVSKTLEATDVENVFDITLTVETKTRIEEIEKVQPLDVVIVMDVSQTMNTTMPTASGAASTVSRYDAAMEAATNFINQFQAASEGVEGNRRIGMVMFNTSAHQVFALSECKTADQASSLITTMETKTSAIVEKDNYSKLHTRFTNMEAGLLRAKDMLASSMDGANQYVVFLTDGFPTTWCKDRESSYVGYCPYHKEYNKNDDSSKCSGKHNSEGLGSIVMQDLKKAAKQGSPSYTYYGTSYSDTAAHWAEEAAASIRGEGIKLFSIGVDIGGQQITTYENQRKNDKWSVIESVSPTDKEKQTWLHGQDYVIGSDTDGFVNWLTKYISSGEGYYYSSDDKAALESAFNNIFEIIKEQTEYAVNASWVAEDPISSTTDPDDPDYIEFIQLIDQDGNLSGNSLSGAIGEGEENTATWNSDTDSIDWDLKKSGYTSRVEDNTTFYKYQLKYRVRLENERDGFVDSQTYDTNGETTMVYREAENGVLGDLKLIQFPIPKVKGYLEELTFDKLAEGTDAPVEGAVFELRHVAACNKCHGDGEAVPLTVYTATSDKDGKVTFANIPSGHDYILKETDPTICYYLNEDQYPTVVRYNSEHTDAVITVTDPDGKPVDLSTFTIYNVGKPALPNTGGIGTNHFTTLGIALMLGAGVLLLDQRRRKEETSAN